MCPVIAAIVLLAASPAPPHHAVRSATVRIAFFPSRFNPETPTLDHGRLAMHTPIRERMPDNVQVVGVAISPPPAALPQITFQSSAPSVVTIHEDRVSPQGVIPAVPLGQAVLESERSGYAVITVRIGQPYNTQLQLPVSVDEIVPFADRNLVGDYSSAYAIDADGQRMDPPDGAADITVEMRDGRDVMDFPDGAVLAPIGTYGKLHVSDWRDAVRSAFFDDVAGPVLIRSHLGGMIELSSVTRYPTMLRAPAHGDFPIVPPIDTMIERTIALTAQPAQRTRLMITSAAPELIPFGSPIITKTLVSPIVVGYDPSTATPYGSDPFVQPIDMAAIPEPYATYAPHWSATGSAKILKLERNNGSAPVAVAASGVGHGTVTVAAVGATKTLPVLAYPVLRIGCADFTPGFGVAFGNDGIARIVAHVADADLYAADYRDRFTCVQPGSGAGHEGGWYFPHGGVVLPYDGAFSSARNATAVPFSAIESSMWRADRVDESGARYFSDQHPCETFQGDTYGWIPACSTNPLSILLIRTRLGRYVKLLQLGNKPGSFIGLYQVSRADGTFSY